MLLFLSTNSLRGRVLVLEFGRFYCVGTGALFAAFTFLRMGIVTLVTVSFFVVVLPRSFFTLATSRFFFLTRMSVISVSEIEKFDILFFFFLIKRKVF